MTSLLIFQGKYTNKGSLETEHHPPAWEHRQGQTPGTPAPDLSVRTKGTALLADSSSNTLVSLWIICSGKRGRMYLASVHVLSVITRCSCIAFLCITGFKFQFFFLPYSFAAAGQALREPCAVATSVIFPAARMSWGWDKQPDILQATLLQMTSLGEHTPAPADHTHCKGPALLPSVSNADHFLILSVSDRLSDTGRAVKQQQHAHWFLCQTAVISLPSYDSLEVFPLLLPPMVGPQQGLALSVGPGPHNQFIPHWHRWRDGNILQGFRGMQQECTGSLGTFQSNPTGLFLFCYFWSSQLYHSHVCFSRHGKREPTEGVLRIKWQLSLQALSLLAPTMLPQLFLVHFVPLLPGHISGHPLTLPLFINLFSYWWARTAHIMPDVASQA